ncbi:MAG TPA: hypothetical protein VGH35_03540 [Gaiellaceae bacterium]|jgi:ABC-type uncharacterized transport system ATPase subunit
MRGEHVLDPTVRARAAVRHLLESPGIAERCRPLLCADEPDWAALLEEAKTMSGGQRLLVAVAYELWEAEGAVGVSLLARGLDRTAFERVVGALRLFRGEESAPPALADAA